MPLKQCERLRDVYLGMTDASGGMLGRMQSTAAMDVPVFSSLPTRQAMLNLASNLARCVPSVRTVIFLSGPRRKEILVAYFWKGKANGIYDDGVP